MGETFENRDLTGAVFRSTNLRGAVFFDVNLEGASITDANLAGCAIDDAYIKGMTVFGFRIDQLIEAELDRRDPERVRLRIPDPYDPGSVRAVMQRLDEVRDDLRKKLRAADPSQLAARPSADERSVIEIVRHLVFAEDLYLNRWVLCNDVPWCTVGLLPQFLADDPHYANVGSEPPSSLDELLAAWDAIHASMQAYISQVTTDQLRRDTSEIDFGQGTVGGILQGMAQHDLGHIRDAERILAAREAEHDVTGR